MKSFRWAKIWDDWWTSRSHSELGGVALAVGARLISVANAAKVRGQITTPDGAPRTCAAIAREVRFPEDQVAQAFEELHACGTLAKNESGVWFFPNFLAYQEDPTTAKKRERAAKDKEEAEKLRKEAGNSAEIPEETPVVFRTEDRGQRKEERPKTKDSAPKAGRVAKSKDGPEVQTIVRHYRSTRSFPNGVVWNPSPADRTVIRQRLADGFSVEQVMRALDLARMDPFWQDKGPASILKDSTRVAKLAEKPTSTGITPEQFRREREEVAARDAARPVDELFPVGGWR